MAFRAKEGQLEELSRVGEQALNSQPFSALIGARLTSLAEGKTVLERAQALPFALLLMPFRGR